MAADGIVGPLSVAALHAAVARKYVAGQLELGGLVPADSMPATQMNRVIVHWTAGALRAPGLDRSEYYILIEGHGKLVRGIPRSIEMAAAARGLAMRRTRQLQHRLDRRRAVLHGGRGLAFDPSIVGAKACGDQFRSSTSSMLVAL